MSLHDSRKLKKFGRGGIRTHGTRLTYTRFPSVLLKPLGHSSMLRIVGKFMPWAFLKQLEIPPLLQMDLQIKR